MNDGGDKKLGPAEAAQVPQLLTSRQVALLLATTRGAVEAMVRRRQIPHVRIGRRLLFDAAEIASWIDARRVPAQSSPDGSPL